MKTKIIYISGNEVFDMNDIRGAFEQVRNALGLGTDTVLFGVPVDKADALANNETNTVFNTNTNAILTNETPVAPVAEQPIMVDTIIPRPIEISAENIVTDEIGPEIVDSDSIADITEMAEPAPETDVPEPAAPVTDVEEVEEIIVPVKKTRGRQKSAKKQAILTDEIDPAPQSNSDEPVSENKVISILSVLKTKTTESNDTAESDVAEQILTDADDIDITDIDTITETIHEDAVADAEHQETVVSDQPTAEIAQTSVAEDDTESVQDMISDEEPVTPMEKTLEHLLESMTPLREDIEHEHGDFHDEFDNSAVTEDIDFAPDSVSDNISDTETDATLQQLANEFAEKQNDIMPSQKNTSHGKIGKLKNILPFKKVKHDDSGLMGDLFGWAGIAANDEDFAIPGFFTNAAAKK